MKVFGGGLKFYLHPFLTSVLDGGDWSASHTSRFTPRVKSPRCLLNRRLGGPQNQSGRRGEEKNLLPLPEFEHWIVQRVT
jgi:hypothetical protein